MSTAYAGKPRSIVCWRGCFSGNLLPGLSRGYALELRFQSARSTIDIDLTVRRLPDADHDPSQTVREMLQEAAAIELGDWFEYRIGSPVMDLTAAPYGGARYPLEALMDRRIFSRCHLDAGIGDVLMDPLETRLCRDWMEFAGIETNEGAMIPCEQAGCREKIHSYTLPRVTPNSRVKDLLDLALLIGAGDLDEAELRNALQLTFDRRNTHELPDRFGTAPGGLADSIRSDCAGMRRVNGSGAGICPGSRIPGIDDLEEPPVACHALERFRLASI